MHGMMEHEMGGDKDAYLEVLQEIKDLMDSRLGDKLKGGMSIEKVSVEGEPVAEEAKMEGEPVMEEKKEDMGISTEEMDELKNKVYSKM